MKKTITVLIAAGCLTLTACDSGSADDFASDLYQSTVQNISSGSSNEQSSSSHISEISMPILEPEKFKQTGVIAETVLYNQNNVKITASGLTYNNYNVELELNIENNSETDLSIRSGTMAYSCNSVNGYMVDMGYLNCEVAAGKKANDTVKFSYSSLRMYGINEIADIEIGFDIDSADIFDDKFEEIYTGPCAVKTSVSDSYDYSESTFRKAMSDTAVQGEFGISLNYISDDKLYDSSGISVISKVIAANKDGDKILFLEVENTTSEEVNIRTSDISLNGLKIYGSNYSYDTINPGKRCIVDVSFDNILDKQYWVACGLSEVNSVGLSFIVLKSDDTEIFSTNLTVTANSSGAMFSSDGVEVYNKNGVNIISKGLFGGESDYDDNYYLLLLVENSSENALIVDDKYDSLSVNGYMTDYFCGTAELGAGETQVLKIRLDGDSLAKNKIEDIDGIENVEFTVRIRDNDYKEIDTSAVKITF